MLGALAAQALAAGALALAGWLLPASTGWPLWAWALAQGLLAALAARVLGLPRWWFWISLGFAPLLFAGWLLTVATGLSPLWWLAGFALLLLVFGRTDRSRVPLYLSNARTAQAVAELLTAPSGRFIDLGCGDGLLLRRLARAKPGWSFEGVEHAPLTFAWAWLAARGTPNLRIRRASLWATPLGPFDVVYAFLSPVPMPELWRKACAELHRGSRLVSNSFEVPGVQPARTVHVGDGRQTRLLVYTSETRSASG